MLHYDASTNASIIFWLVVAATSLLFQCFGFYLLFSQRNKKVMDCLLLHLSAVELALILWQAFHNIRYAICGMDLSKPTKLHQMGLIILLVGQMISVILITADRVLAVSLTIRYRAIVTKRRLKILFAAGWVLCISHGFIPYYFSFKVLNEILTAWDILVAIIIFTGYGYIVIIVQFKNRALVESNQYTKRPNLKLTVPGLILSAFVLFCLIPDLLLAICIRLSLWILSNFYLNFLTDSLIYIFGSGRIQSRVRNSISKISLSRSRYSTTMTTEV